MATNDEYSRRTFDFVARIQKLRDYKAIVRAIEIELEWYGLTAFTSLTSVGPDRPVTDAVLANTRPQEYILRYVQQNYVVRDPLVTELRRKVHIYSWNDLRNDRPLSKEQRFIIDEASEFGLRDGLTVPIATASGLIDIFSPCGEAPNLSERARQALDVVCTYAHKALQLAAADKSRNESHRPLTEREREVIKWVANGKTDEEIGLILSVSANTVHGYMKSAMLKLNAGRRTYAVVQALRFGEIAL
jgi:LuxR family transcriptional regulator, quorum-sensing system regulator BjaR1